MEKKFDIWYKSGKDGDKDRTYCNCQCTMPIAFLIACLVGSGLGNIIHYLIEIVRFVL